MKNLILISLLCSIFLANCTTDPLMDENTAPAVTPATPSIIQISYVSNSVLLTWDQVQHAQEYKIYTNVNSSNNNFNLGASTSSNQITLSNIDDNNVYYFTISATNRYGESQQSTPVFFINDTEPPQVTMVTPTTNIVYTSGNSVQFECAISDNTQISNSQYLAIVNNVTNFYPLYRTFSLYSDNLIEGTNSVVISAEDIYGNTSSCLTIIVKDMTPPAITNITFSTTLRTASDVIVWGYAEGATNYCVSNIATYSGNVQLSFYDKAGNRATTNININWIDKFGPSVAALYTKNLSDRVRVKWVKPSNSDFSYMEIYRKAGSVPIKYSLDGMTRIFTGTNETFFEDTNVTIGTKYYYVSATYDDLSNRSISKISYSFFPYLDMRQSYSLAREDIGLAYYDNKIYMMGGARANPSYEIWNVQKYDLVSDTITEIAHLLNPLVWFQGAVINNKIFAFGGNWFTATTECYDIVSDSWQYITPLPHVASDIINIVHDGNIYLIGGTVASGQYTNWCMQYVVTNGVHGYYSNLAPKPLKEYAYGGAVYADKIYVFSQGSTETHVEIYDINNNTWSRGTSLGVQRGDFATAVVSDKIYLVGGFETGAATARIDEYNTDTDTWSRKTDLAWPRYGISAIAVNNEIYLIGGRNGSMYYGTIEVYQPLNDN